MPSALEWLDRLDAELASRQAKMQQFDDYYTGEHPLPFLTPAHHEKLRGEFRRLLDESRTNFCRLVVDASEERLRVEGFRLSSRSTAETDRHAWDIWQANQMDAEAPAAVVEALVKGVSYLSVWEAVDDEAYPVIAVEDPSQTIVAYVPGSGFRRRAAALKRWSDEWSGLERANVYLPEGIYKFSRKALPKDGPRGAVTNLLGRRDRGWELLEDEPSFVRNRLGVVPIVPLRNRPRVLVEGESELADVTLVQNQINGLVFNLALAGYFGAHRQRWVAGVKLTDDTGNDIDPFNTAIDALWATENPDARFGDLAQTDLTQYIRAIEQKVLHIAVTTRTPRHYLIEQGQSPSGDAIKSAESGLIQKVRRKMRPFGEGFEEAIRLARLFAGESDAPVDSEIVWADPEIRTEAEITDAAIKKLQAGLVDQRQALEDCGYSQVQIERILAAAPAPDVNDDGDVDVDAEAVTV